MKIALFCPNYPPSEKEGGIAHYTRQLARHLSTLGEEITVIAGDDYSGDGTDGDITVLKLGGVWGRSTVKAVAAELAARDVDIVNLQYSPVMYPVGFKFGWPGTASKCRSTVSFHTLWGGPKLNYLAALKLLLTANGIIATNSEIMYLLRRYLPFFSRKLHFIPIGASIEPDGCSHTDNVVGSEYGLDPDTLVIAYFGMIYPGKGLDFLLRTAQELAVTHHIGFRLLMIGGGISDTPQYRSEAEHLASALGLSDKLIWTGRIPVGKVSELLSRSNVMILPYDGGVSDRRSSLMAALAHHKAVVTTKPAIPIPLFKNGENMIWPASGSPESMAKTLLEVCRNERLRSKLEKGAEQLAKHFQWSDIARETQSCFRQLTKERSTRTIV